MSETNSAHLGYIDFQWIQHDSTSRKTWSLCQFFLGPQTDLAPSSGQHSRLTSQASSKGDQPALERRRGCAPAPELPRSKLWSAWLEAK